MESNERICPYCLGKFKNRDMNDDHVTPHSRGGDRNNNIVRCCVSCNTEKSNMTLLEFALYVQYMENLSDCTMDELRNMLTAKIARKNRPLYNAINKLIKNKKDNVPSRKYVFSLQ